MRRILKYIFLFPLSILLWIKWWCTAIFSISFLLIISIIVPKKYFNPIVTLVCKILMYTIFIFPRKKGIKEKDIPYPVIFVGNHVSFFDLFISGSILPGYPRGLELKSHFSTPFYGWFITRFGQIPIDTKSRANLRRSFEDAINLLKNKTRNLFVMPEGTRTRDGNLSKFKSGAFYLSRKSGIPIVPVVYKGLYDRNNRKNLIIIPGVFDAVILHPVYPDKFKTDDQMGEYIRGIMQLELDKKL